MSFKSPHYTQTPNELFDEMLPHMSESELKVTLAVIRSTLGWHKRRDELSIPRLMKMTGLSYNAVTSGAKSAVKRGTIKRTMGGGSDRSAWEICIDDTPSNSEGVSQPAPPPPSNSEAPPNSEGQQKKDLIGIDKKKENEKETTTTEAQPQEKTPEPQSQVVVVGDDGFTWPIDLITHAAGQPVTFWDHERAVTFISYWLYAMEHTSINNPVRWADVNTRRGGRAAKKYVDMVIAGPSKVIAGDHWGTGWGESARAMCANGLRDLLAPMIGLESKSSNWDTVEDIDPPVEHEPLYPAPHPRIHKRNGSTMTPAMIWQSAKGQIQMEMPKAAFDHWVKDVELHDYADCTFVLIAPNDVSRDWVQNRLDSTAQRLLTGIANQSGIEIKYITPQEAA